MNADAILLTALRPYADCSDVQWQAVVKAVETAGGVRAVSGRPYAIIQKAAKKFSSRSEAGRYAANQRWKNRNTGGGTDGGTPAPASNLSPDLDRWMSSTEERLDLLSHSVDGILSKTYAGNAQVQSRSGELKETVTAPRKAITDAKTRLAAGDDPNTVAKDLNTAFLAIGRKHKASKEKVADLTKRDGAPRKGSDGKWIVSEGMVENTIKTLYKRGGNEMYDTLRKISEAHGTPMPRYPAGWN